MEILINAIYILAAFDAVLLCGLVGYLVLKK
jgi:hypothetical protein